MRWELIETAPKDGTAILLFYADQRGMVEGYWFSSPKQTDDGWYVEIFGYPGDPGPTHWMELPSPPRNPTTGG